MASRSAGILLYRLTGGHLELLIGHMGGPFWSTKDEGAWSIIKGEYQGDEDPLVAARREFLEETGHAAPPGPAVDLGEIRQASGKRVRAWAIEGDLDPEAVVSNTFTMEWPPRSGRMQEFPEIDRALWTDPDDAKRRLVTAQAEFVTRLEAVVEVATQSPSKPHR